MTGANRETPDRETRGRDGVRRHEPPLRMIGMGKGVRMKNRSSILCGTWSESG